jgi:hypothetical protein
MFRVWRIQPFLNTVPASAVVEGLHVKDVFTFASEDRTVVAWDLTVGTAAIEWNSTYSTDIFIRDIPFPYRHRVYSFYFDLHPRRRPLISR